MDASDLEKLIRDLGFSKIRIVNSHNDTNIMFCCPWHGESNPSAGISANKEYGACYACGQGFTLLSLVAYMKDMSLRKARDYLEERYNVKKKTTGKKVRKIKRYGEPDELDEGDESREINNATLPYYRLAPYKSGKVCHDYLLDRGFSKETCRTFKIGWDANRSRITIPIFNIEEQLLGFIVRAVLDENDPDYKRVYGKSDKYLVDNFQRSLTLFPINMFPKGNDTVVLVEGSLDAMRGHQYGFNNVLAVLTSKLSKEQVRLLHRLRVKNIVLAFDDDKAGQEGCKKAYEMLKNDFIVYKVKYPEGKKDIGEMTKQEIQDMLNNKTHYNTISLKKID